MGLILRDTTASFQANAKGMSFPISSTGLKVNAVFGGTLAASLRNFAPGQSALTAAGTPTVNANSIVIPGGTSYLQTAMADAASLTFCAIVKVVDDSQVAFIFHNFNSNSQVHAGVTNGAGLYMTTDATSGDGKMNINMQRAKTNGSTTTTAQAAINSVAVGAFQFICGRFDSATGIRKINNMTTGASGVTAADLTALDLGDAFRIGGRYSTNAASSTELVAAVGMARSISDSEMQTLYSFWQGYCVRRGISI